MQTRITEYYDKRKEEIYIIPNLFLFFFSINMVTILHVNIFICRHANQRFFIILSSSELLTSPSFLFPANSISGLQSLKDCLFSSCQFMLLEIFIHGNITDIFHGLSRCNCIRLPNHYVSQHRSK